MVRRSTEQNQEEDYQGPHHHYTVEEGKDVQFHRMERYEGSLQEVRYVYRIESDNFIKEDQQGIYSFFNLRYIYIIIECFVIFIIALYYFVYFKFQFSIVGKFSVMSMYYNITINIRYLQLCESASITHPPQHPHSRVPTAHLCTRYASLYFCAAVEENDNELLALEIIHRYVEILDKYFGNVSSRCTLSVPWLTPPLPPNHAPKTSTPLREEATCV